MGNLDPWELCQWYRDSASSGNPHTLMEWSRSGQLCMCYLSKFPLMWGRQDRAQLSLVKEYSHSQWPKGGMIWTTSSFARMGLFPSPIITTTVALMLILSGVAYDQWEQLQSSVGDQASTRCQGSFFVSHSAAAKSAANLLPHQPQGGMPMMIWKGLATPGWKLVSLSLAWFLVCGLRQSEMQGNAVIGSLEPNMWRKPCDKHWWIHIYNVSTQSSFQFSEGAVVNPHGHSTLHS